jgi:hypothetical protein
MLEHRLFGSDTSRRHRRLRPTVLAIFSYRYDVDLVPDLLANVETIVDGWIGFDDRRATTLFSNEPQRRRLLIERARELGAGWVLAIDPDERLEHGAASRIRHLTFELRRVVWQLSLRELFTPSSYRVDGIWGSKMQGRLFPVFDGPFCSEQLLHGAWCIAPDGYSILSSGLNLYHLKMLSKDRRTARRDLYQHLDSDNRYQQVGYDYLTNERGAKFEHISPDRDFFPAHRETGNLIMANIPGRRENCASAANESHRLIAPSYDHLETGNTRVSQIGSLTISIGDKVRRDSKLAVIIIGLRAPNSLFDAVRSVMLQNEASEIIVVNSGGGNPSEVLREYLPFIVLVELSRRAYVGEARNIGIQHSRAPYVAFLAADCVAAPHWVAQRVEAHMAGERVVASVIENDKFRNPFAWAAFLMTFGQRIAEASSDHTAAYGASYDRSLFDRYGFFSEAMMVGEDSEFHHRFRGSTRIHLHVSIRTIHCNPGGPVAFLSNQFRRGLRRYHLADFFRVETTFKQIVLTTVRRAWHPVRLSLSVLNGKTRLRAITSWPLLPFGAGAYFFGMLTSYVDAKVAERFFQASLRMALLRRPARAVSLLRNAITLRPVTAKYHQALSVLLKEMGFNDCSARELYTSWDIDRSAINGWQNEYSFGSLGENARRRIVVSIDFTVVVLSDSSDLRLAEFLRALATQCIPLSNLNVLVIDSRGNNHDSEVMRQIRRAYSPVVKFILPQNHLLPLHADKAQDHRPSVGGGWRSRA